MQGELFSVGTARPVVDLPKISQPQVNWLERFQITLRIDHLSIVAIFALVLYVLVFSFGVEKGKGMVIKELEAGKAKQEEAARQLTQAEPVSEPASPKNEGIKQNLQATPLTLPHPKGVEITAPKGLAAGRFTIQVVTFNTKSRAEEEVKKLKAKGHQSFIISGKKTYQVCVEFFEDVGLAREKLGQMKSEGFVPRDAYIRPVKGPVSAI